MFFYGFTAEGEQFEHLLWLWSIKLLFICIFIKICMVRDFWDTLYNKLTQQPSVVSTLHNLS